MRDGRRLWEFGGFVACGAYERGRPKQENGVMPALLVISNCENNETAAQWNLHEGISSSNRGISGTQCECLPNGMKSVGRPSGADGAPADKASPFALSG